MKGNSILDGSIGLLALMGSIIIILVMFGVDTGIFMRYFLNRPFYWIEEVCGYALLYITFLGAAWVLKRDGHVRMDLVLTRLSPRAQALVNTFTSVLGAMICCVITWYGAQSTWDYFQLDYSILSLLKPPQAPIMAVIPIGSLLLFLQFLRRTYGSLRDWRTLTRSRTRAA